LSGSLPVRGLRIGVSAIPLAVPGERRASVVLALNVTAPPGATTGPVSIVAAAFDYASNYEEAATVRQTVALSAGLEPGYEGLARLDLAPGRYELRIAAVSGTTTGSVITDVEVPDVRKAPLSASGLVLATGASRPAAASDIVPRLVPIAPTAVRAFAASDALTSLLQIYRGTTKIAQAAHVRSAIVDSTGKTRAEHSSDLDAVSFGARASADYRWTTPLTQLDPGEYLLSVDATMGDATVHRTARFMIVK